MDWRISTFDTLASTQDHLKTMAEQGAPEGTVVQARTQTAGRGRYGRSWMAGNGNLYCSFLLRPEIPLDGLGQLGLLTGLAVYQTLRDFLPDPLIASLKWPNDVLLQGKKCAGILLETSLKSNRSLAYIMAGIGINVKSGPAPEFAYLNAYAQGAPDVNAVRDSFLNHFEALYTKWRANGFEQIRLQWLEGAHKRGAALEIRQTGQTIAGIFYDIDEWGNMLLQTGQGKPVLITAGDVYLERVMNVARG